MGRIDLTNYDFIDLGSSTGGAIKYAQKRFGWGEAIGVDKDERKVTKAKSEGRPVIQGDCTNLSTIFSGKTNYAIASHFLEHLPSQTLALDVLKDVSGFINKACLIQQPCFDGMDFLKRHNLKLFWADWSGHPNMMTTEDWKNTIHQLIEVSGLYKTAIFGYAKKITSSNDDALIPTSAPRNSQNYVTGEFEAKKDMPFDPCLWREVKILLSHDELTSELHAIATKFGVEEREYFTR